MHSKSSNVSVVTRCMFLTAILMSLFGASLAMAQAKDKQGVYRSSDDFPLSRKLYRGVSTIGLMGSLLRSGCTYSGESHGCDEHRSRDRRI